MLHLCGLAITAIDARREVGLDKCSLGAPEGNFDELAMRCNAALTNAAEHIVIEVGDALLNGQRLGNRSVPYHLIGFCDGNGNMLMSEVEIIATAKAQCALILADCDRILAEGGSIDNQAFFIDVQAKRVVAHFFAAISELTKSPSEAAGGGRRGRLS
jgi:hypothetical protein